MNIISQGVKNVIVCRAMGAQTRKDGSCAIQETIF